MAIRPSVRPARTIVRPPVRRPDASSVRLRRPSFGFAREIYSELKKVTWPTRIQVRDLTVVVIALSTVVGILLGGVDFLFSKLVEILILNPL